MSLLAAMPVEADLQAALNALTRLPVGNPWRTVFTNLRTRHSWLRGAVVDGSGAAYPPGSGSAYTPTLLVEPTEEQLQPPITALSKIVRDARLKSANYQRYGRFDGAASNVLSLGMQESQIDLILSELNLKLGALDGAIASYRTNRESLIRNLLQELQATRDRENIRTKARIQLRKYENLSKDLAQMRLYTALEEQR